ncbi:MAG: hypothetical protein RL648_952, partial [Verrucomicrobiota bacterium]
MNWKQALWIFCIVQAGWGGLSAVEVERVEPLNWWTRMPDPEVQVLLYGEALGGLEARVDHTGIRVSRTVRVENPAYLFVYLEVSSEAMAGRTEITLWQDGAQVAAVPFDLRERRPSSAQRKGFGP